MVLFIASIASMAIVFGLAMLWQQGKDKNDESMKWIAGIALVAFFLLALILGSCSGD